VFMTLSVVEFMVEMHQVRRGNVYVLGLPRSRGYCSGARQPCGAGLQR